MNTTTEVMKLCEKIIEEKIEQRGFELISIKELGRGHPTKHKNKTKRLERALKEIKSFSFY